MSLVIDVVLHLEDGNDVLSFKFTPNISINLNIESQQDLKKVFSKLLELSTKEDISLNLVPAVDYDNILIKEVCKEYVDALNAEIRQVAEEVRIYFKTS